MTQVQDLCPNQTDGNHRYFVFKTVEVFVPYVFTLDGSEDNTTVEKILVSIPQLYEKKEQAVLGCNCGSVIKTEVKGQ